MRFACGSRFVDDVKVKRRFAGFASSLILSACVSISVRGTIVVLVVLDVVVLAMAVVDVIVERRRRGRAEAAPRRNAQRIAGSLPASSSSRSR